MAVQKRKGRLTKEQSEKKRLDGKRMFINGLSYTEISKILEVHIDTVKKYALADHWEDAKKMHQVSIGEMKAEVLNTFHSLKNGEKPKLSADQITKVVAAFEKLNDRKKNVAYAVENFELLTNALIQKATKSSSKKQKEERIHILKYVSEVMQQLVNDLYQEALND